MGFLGLGKGTKVKNKTSNAEKLARTLALEKATDPWSTDSSAMAKGLTSEMMGRFHEPAAIDPRIADILGSLSPQMSGMGQATQGLIQGIMGAPTSSPLGMRPYGQPATPWAPSLPSATGGDVHDAAYWRGSTPSRAFTDQTKQVGDRLSGRIIDQLLDDKTPGELQREAVGKHLKTKAGRDIFGVSSTPMLDKLKGWM